MFKSQKLETEGLQHAKWAFTTRRVNRNDVAGFSTAFSHADTGDLVLARITDIGYHKRVQLTHGRPSTSYPGDWVVLACGDRYAPDQFEAIGEIDPDRADLVAGGGIIGRIRVSHDRISHSTKLKPVALLTGQDGKHINLAHYSLPALRSRTPLPVLLVVGASMNAGKTTAAASLAHGLHRAGKRVAAIKATGTGAYGDLNTFSDAGINIVMDFTDAGMASTYRQPIHKLEDAFQTLMAHAAVAGAELAVVELADGIYQQETAALLKSRRIRQHVKGLVYATGDAISAVGGVQHLTQLGLRPAAVSGKISCSPLAATEARAHFDMPVLSRLDLCNPKTASGLFHSVTPERYVA